jgi:hypothetical protein
MPAQQRVRRRDRGDLAQNRTARAVRPRGQSSAIVIREAQPPPSKLAPQEPVFFDQICDRLPLAAIQPAVSTPSTIFSAAGSITSRSSYHGHA